MSLGRKNGLVWRQQHITPRPTNFQADILDNEENAKRREMRQWQDLRCFQRSLCVPPWFGPWLRGEIGSEFHQRRCVYTRQRPPTDFQAHFLDMGMAITNAEIRVYGKISRNLYGKISRYLYGNISRYFKRSVCPTRFRGKSARKFVRGGASSQMLYTIWRWLK